MGPVQVTPLVYLHCSIAMFQNAENTKKPVVKAAEKSTMLLHVK